MGDRPDSRRRPHSDDAARGRDTRARALAHPLLRSRQSVGPRREAADRARPCRRRLARRRDRGLAAEGPPGRAPAGARRGAELALQQASADSRDRAARAAAPARRKGPPRRGRRARVTRCALPRRGGRGPARNRGRRRRRSIESPAPGAALDGGPRRAESRVGRAEAPRPEPGRRGRPPPRAADPRQCRPHPRRGLGRDRRRGRQLPDPLSAERRLRLARRAGRPRVDLPLRRPGDGVRAQGLGPVLSLPLRAAPAARARTKLRRRRRAGSAAGGDRLDSGLRGTQARARHRPPARRAPAPLRRPRRLLLRGRGPPRPGLPGLRREPHDHRVRRLRRVLRRSRGRVIVPAELRRELERHARDQAPNEACGLLLLRDGRAVRYERGRNAEASPYRFRLEVEPEVWFLEDDGYELAVFHSHPASPPNPSRPDLVRAASGGESRLIRFSHGPAAWYTRSARRALDLWLELERESRAELFVPSGVAWFFRAEDGWSADSERVLREEAVPVERLSPEDAARLFPSFGGEGLSSVLYEPDAGVLRAREATRTLVEQAILRGARFAAGTAAPDGDGVSVAGERLAADRIVWFTDA